MFCSHSAVPYSCVLPKVIHCHYQWHLIFSLGCCGFYFFGVIKSKVNHSIFVMNSTGASLPPKNSSCGVEEHCTSSREPLSATPGPSHGSLNAERQGRHSHSMGWIQRGLHPLLLGAPKSYFRMSRVAQILYMGYVWFSGDTMHILISSIILSTGCMLISKNFFSFQ